MRQIEPIPLEAIRSARDRISGVATRTPLIRLNVDNAPSEVYLKLENLQPIGSFKLRGAANAMALADADELAGGVYTASAGNMAQGVAYVARQRGIDCSVVVPENSPRTKLAAIERLGAHTIMVSYDEWWKVLIEHRFPGLTGKFIHPVCDPDVIAGNGTIGLEILDDLPDVETIIVPYGGGGLSSGIASAVNALRPRTRIYAAEVETAAPLAASLAAGSPQTIDHTPSFVDGIGGKSLLPEMWNLVRSVLDGSLVVSLSQIAEAIRLLIERNRIVAEGAGASSAAAALAGKAGTGRTVCVISGGNIDAAKLITILGGDLP
ncbi:MAG: pyridoxal-phosphate dependent enzyme [Planctomycetes bacterium]|nr:pyridoxal-phosphate dependent enzyme [Planctomycetota bacterium]